MGAKALPGSPGRPSVGAAAAETWSLLGIAMLPPWTSVPSSLPLPAVPRPSALHNPISTLTADSQRLSLGHHMARSLSSVFFFFFSFQFYFIFKLYIIVSVFSRCLPGAVQDPVGALKGVCM